MRRLSATFFHTVLWLFLVSHTSTPQLISVEPLATRYPLVRGDIYSGHQGRITAVGVSETTSVWTMYFGSTTASVPFIAIREPGGPPTVRRVLQSEILHNNRGFSGTYASFASAYGEDEAGRRLAALREQTRGISDVLYPQVWREPVVTFYDLIDDSLTVAFRITFADHPDVAPDRDGGFHMVWEALSPLTNGSGDFWHYGPDSNYYFTRSQIMHSRRFPDSSVDTAVAVGIGFRPRLLVDGNNHVSVVWLRGDSSNSPTFELVLSTPSEPAAEPIVLADTVKGYREYSYNSLPPSYSVFADSRGTFHAGWSDRDGYEITGFHFVSLTDTGTIRGDTVFTNPSGSGLTPPVFHVDSAGSARAVWSSTDGSARTLKYSRAEPGHPLFRNVREFSSVTSHPMRPTILTDSHGKAHYLVEQYAAGIGYVRDLDAAPDSVIQLSAQHSIADALNVDVFNSGESHRPWAVIDGEDQIWTLGSATGASLLRVEKHTTSVGRESAPIPGTLVLEQNYPNPFNPATTIRFILPSESWVHLNVVDILGRTVVRLIDKQLGVGSHSVRFEPHALPSGVYMYTLRANGATATRRMLLLR